MAVEAAMKSAGLAGVIADLGYGCTQTESALEDVVKQFPSVDEPAIARVLGMMVRTHTKLDDRTVTQAKLPDLFSTHLHKRHSTLPGIDGWLCAGGFGRHSG